MVILQHDDDDDFYHVDDPTSWPATVLAQIKLSTLPFNKNQTTIFMLSPASVQVEQAAKRLLQQVTTKWPQVGGFLVNNVRLHSLGLAIMASFTKSNWPLLTDLKLTNYKLDSQGTSFLIQGRFPKLKRLDLSQNCLDHEAMALLVRGNWPSLQSLDFGFNPSLNSKAIAHLSATHWPLETLIKSDLSITYSMASALAKLQLPHLMYLGLDQTSMTTAAMSGLLQQTGLS